MKLDHELYDQAVIVRIEGELNEDQLQPLQQLLDEQSKEGVRDVVLDMNKTEFVDSAALERLVGLREEAEQRLGQLRLSGLPDNIRIILRITRLESQFEIASDVEQALQSLK